MLFSIINIKYDNREVKLHIWRGTYFVDRGTIILYYVIDSTCMVWEEEKKEEKSKGQSVAAEWTRNVQTTAWACAVASFA